MNGTELEQVRSFFQTFARSFLKVQEEGVRLWGVTGIQGHILYALANSPQSSLKGLANALGFDNSFISRQVQQLVQNELVQRITDESDRRFVKLSLTPKGLSKQQEISAYMEDYVKEIMVGIDEQNRAKVIESLGLMLNSFKKFHLKD